MQFIVIARGNEAPVAPSPQELARARATYEQLASGDDPRIKAVYPFADTRGAVLVVDMDSADELAQWISSLPASRQATFESHPIISVEKRLSILSQAEQAKAGQVGQ
jgi:hypothetical protein